MTSCCGIFCSRFLPILSPLKIILEMIFWTNLMLDLICTWLEKTRRFCRQVNKKISSCFWTAPTCVQRSSLGWCSRFTYMETVDWIHVDRNNVTFWGPHSSASNLIFHPGYFTVRIYISDVAFFSNIQVGSYQWSFYRFLKIFQLCVKLVNWASLSNAVRSSARFVLGNYDRRASVTSMLNKLQWPSLESRRQQNRLAMLYRIRFNLVDINWTSYLAASSSNTSGHNSRFWTPYYIATTHTNHHSSHAQPGTGTV